MKRYGSVSMTATARNAAKPLRLYARAKDRATSRNRQVRAISKLDGRTRIGRIEKAFRADLLDHFNGAPDIIQRELIEQCVELKVTCCELRAKRMAGKDTGFDRDRYNAFFNSLCRTLVKLGFRERSAIERIRAEADLTRASAKR